jgi:hypothetical protein
MRGSPLIRFLILAIALVVTGLGLIRVTSARGTRPSIDSPTVLTEPIPEKQIPFSLILSAPAEEIEINTGKLIHPPASESPISGTVLLDPGNPRISLKVRWKHPPAAGEHRFAKLTLEAEAQETFTHVFDAAGDIDDLIELPFPANP